MELSNADAVRLVHYITVTTWVVVLFLMVLKPGIDHVFKRWIPADPPAIKVRAAFLAALLPFYWLLPPQPRGPFENSELEPLSWVSIGLVAFATLHVMRHLIYNKLFPLLSEYLERQTAKQKEIATEAEKRFAQTGPLQGLALFQDRAVRFLSLLVAGGVIAFLLVSLIQSLTQPGLPHEGLLLLLDGASPNKQQWLALAEITVTVVFVLLILFLVIIPMFKTAFKDIPQPPDPRRKAVIYSGLAFGLLLGGAWTL